MIRAMLYAPQTGELTQSDAALVQTWHKQPDSVLWLDLHEASAEEERRLLEHELGLAPLAVQDAQRQRHPPKIEAFDGFVFLLFKGLAVHAERIDFSTIQIAVFFAPRLLVTRHDGPSPSIERLRARVQTQPILLGAGTDRLAVSLARHIVDRYLPMLLDLEPRLEAAEDEMIANPRDALLAELTGLKSNLKKLRRLLAYHLQVVQGMRRTLDRKLKHEINDVYEHLERASTLTNLHHELVGDLIEGYISVASHRLNQIMKVLTIVTAIFVPLSFLAGIYGMNFEHMPELHSPYGYFGLLSAMAIIAAVLLYTFKRKRWL